MKHYLINLGGDSMCGSRGSKQIVEELTYNEATTLHRIMQKSECGGYIKELPNVDLEELKTLWKNTNPTHKPYYDIDNFRKLIKEKYEIEDWILQWYFYNKVEEND